MLITVKALKEEFEEACSNGYVYGRAIKGVAIPVYIKLGKEVKRKPHPKDNTSTRYKLFIGCTVYFGETEEEIDKASNLNNLLHSTNVTVTLFC